MPFNSSGFFQRLFRWRSDRDAGIKILAERMDQEMDGIVDGVNDIVSGQVPLQGPVKNVNGTAAAPAYSFEEDNDTGIYRAANDVIGVSVGGEKKLEVSTSELKFDDHKVHHAGNDGEGSGLDADLLDGQDGTFYQNADNLNAGEVPTSRLSGNYNIDISGNAATASNATAHIVRTDNPHGVTVTQIGAVSQTEFQQQINGQAQIMHRQFQLWEAYKAAHGTYPGEI